MDTTAPSASARTDHSIWPAISCEDPHSIRAWLVALGFVEGILVPDAEGAVRHSEMLWPEGGRVMISSASKADRTFVRSVGAGSLYVVTGQPDRVLDRARAVGATVTREMEDADYGSRGFSLSDPEGNSWSFGTYAG